jgi:hypothetical protein
MKTQEYKKKVWTKPVVTALNIRKDTFSGTEYGSEYGGKGSIPVKS